MLGERYGWHDMSDITNMKDELLEQTFQNAIDAGYEWVAKFKDRSVTELEIIYGALRYIPIARMQSFGETVDYGYSASDEVKERELQGLNSFFYLRDPSCTFPEIQTNVSVKADLRHAISVIDSIKSDQKALYSAENFLAKHKTYELRETIRSSELPWKGYRDLEAFKLHVTEDIIASIDKRFNQDAEPTPFEMENLRRSRKRFFSLYCVV
jgi:hypothetical protein